MRLRPLLQSGVCTPSSSPSGGCDGRLCASGAELDHVARVVRPDLTTVTLIDNWGRYLKTVQAVVLFHQNLSSSGFGTQ